MREDIEMILNRIVTDNNSKGREIITGYNHLDECLSKDYQAAFMFSNIRSCPIYQEAVLCDIELLDLKKGSYSVKIRPKRGVYHWKSTFYFRNDNCELQDDLELFDLKKRVLLPLNNLPEKTLRAAGFSDEDCRFIIAQNGGYEIAILLKDIYALHKISDLFLKKSLSINEGYINPLLTWPNAWRYPLLLIQGNIESNINLPGFTGAYIFRHEDSVDGEYSFIINNSLSLLMESAEYLQLVNRGFKLTECLVNIIFLQEYVDEPIIS